jgi:uncharacterized membrane protein
MTHSPLLSAPLAIRAHRKTMLSLFWLALVGAGLFTLLPGRIMGQMVFGW